MKNKSQEIVIAKRDGYEFVIYKGKIILITLDQSKKDYTVVILSPEK